MDPRNFFGDLKRRHVYRVAVAYAVVGWLLVQVATQVFPFFEIPNWAVRLVVLAITETAPGQRAPAALPGMSIAGSAGVLARTPLQPGGAGSPAFDAQGRLAGLITGNPSERTMVAGVAVQRSYRMAASGDIEAFLAKAGIRLAASSAKADLSTGAIVEGAVAGVVGVSCGI